MADVAVSAGLFLGFLNVIKLIHENLKGALDQREALRFVAEGQELLFEFEVERQRGGDAGKER